jgi:hypothetical protein
MNEKRLWSVVVTLAAFACTCAIAGTASTAPGTYQDWNGIDQVTILQPFHAASYQQTAVESFDSSGVKLPDPKDNTYEAVRSALQMIKPAFIDGVEKKARHSSPTPGPLAH